MPTLGQDLETYADEYFTKGDLDSGKKLLTEVAGLVMLAGGAITLVTMFCPPISLKAGGLTAVTTLHRLGICYTKADASQRKHIRAVVSWVKGGFTLGHRLLG